VIAAVTFGGIAAGAFASTASVSILADSLSATIASTLSIVDISLQVTRIVDIESGIAVFSLAGARRLAQRLLQAPNSGASGATVTFVVLVSATAPAGAATSVQELLTPTDGPGSTSSPAFDAFAIQAVVNIAAAANAAGNTKLAAEVTGSTLTRVTAISVVPEAPIGVRGGATIGTGEAIAVGIIIGIVITVAALAAPRAVATIKLNFIRIKRSATIVPTSNISEHVAGA
jgi:hypothetical protein